MLRRTLTLAAALAFITLPAVAGNGHLLHGVGAVNSSMGGSGVALKTDPISALHTNPALLTQFEGYEVGISLEIFDDAPRIDSCVHCSDPATIQTGSHSADTELGVIPAIGAVLHKPGSKWGWGFGVLGVAGFRTDYPGDQNDPVFVAQPDGYGRVHTDLVITKIPIALAYQVNPRLSIGGELAVFRGNFGVNPFPVAPAECNIAGTNTAIGDPRTAPGGAGNADCFFPPASNQVSAWAVALQLGFYFQINPKWAVGASYLTPQSFSEYNWNSTHPNPNLANFAQPRSFGEDVDGPETLALGLGFTPNPKLRFALDVKWVNYEDTDGFGGQLFEFVTTGSDQGPKLRGIGWDNILIALFGFEWDVNPTFTLRGGLNFNESPIANDRVFQSLGTPSTYEQHYTLGAGIRVTPNLRLDFGAYYVPRNEISGPILSFTQPAANGYQVPDSQFTISDPITSGLVALTFTF